MTRVSVSEPKVEAREACLRAAVLDHADGIETMMGHHGVVVGRPVRRTSPSSNQTAKFSTRPFVRQAVQTHSATITAALILNGCWAFLTPSLGAGAKAIRGMPA